MSSSFDLLSIGDASLDVFLTPTETEKFCQIDTKECYIALSYGDKIPVKHLEFSIGGNAANNAVGARRLGIASAVMLTLGDDDIGNQILERLIKEQVDTSYVFRQRSTGSNYSTIISYGGERTILSYKAPRSYKFPTQMPESHWIYLTSMGESFRPFYNHLANWLKKNKQVKLAFNPGSRQIRAGIDALQEIMDLTYVIYVNRKEAETLTGMTSSQGKEKELLVALSKLGPKVCIITDGANGSYLYNGERFIRAGVLPVDAYERTGAGDAFGAGCIAALIKGKTWEEALLYGTLNSASVIGYVGSQKGLLKEDEMPVWLERARSSNVEVREF